MNIIIAVLLGLSALAEAPLAENEMIADVDRLNRESTIHDPTAIHCNLPSDWRMKLSERRIAIRQLPGEDAAQMREAYVEKGILRRSHLTKTSMFRVLSGDPHQWPQIVKEAFAAAGLSAGQIGSVTYAPLWWSHTGRPIYDAYIKFNDRDGGEIQSVHYSTRDAQLTRCAAQAQPLPPPPLIKVGIEGLWHAIHSSTISNILARFSAHIVSRYGCCADLGNTVVNDPQDGAYLVRPHSANNGRRGVDLVFTVLDRNNAPIQRGECNFDLKVEGGMAVYDRHACKDLPLPSAGAKSEFPWDRVTNALAGSLHDGEITAINRVLDRYGLLFGSNALLDFEGWKIALKNRADPNIELTYKYNHPTRSHRGKCKFSYQIGVIPFLVDATCTQL